MSFSGDIKKFTKIIKQRNNDVFVGVAEEVHRSIQTGSEITGAPGQPVGGHQPGRRYVGGALRASWQLQIDPDSALISTNMIYAPQIEDGTREGRALTLWSPVGGFHSVKTTIAGFDKIVEHVLKKVVHG